MLGHIQNGDKGLKVRGMINHAFDIINNDFIGATGATGNGIYKTEYNLVDNEIVLYFDNGGTFSYPNLGTQGEKGEQGIPGPLESDLTIDNITINELYQGNLVTINATPTSGKYTIDLSVSNLYNIILTDDLELDFKNAATTTYTFLIKPTSFTCDITDSKFKTADGYPIFLTTDSIVSGIYDGTNMWITYIKNYSNI